MTLQQSQFADELDGALAFTSKEFRHIAQGCRASRLPWVGIANDRSTLKGLRPPRTTNDGTPLGYRPVTHPSPRVVAKRDNPGL